MSTVDGPNKGERASRSIDACFARELEPARYAPFHVGSDVVCANQPPLACARQRREPAHIQAPRLVGCEEKTSSIHFSLDIDRRDEP